MYTYATSEFIRIYATSIKAAETFFSKNTNPNFTATFQGKQQVNKNKLERIAKGIYVKA